MFHTVQNMETNNKTGFIDAKVQKSVLTVYQTKEFGFGNSGMFSFLASCMLQATFFQWSKAKEPHSSIKTSLACGWIKAWPPPAGASRNHPKMAATLSLFDRHMAMLISLFCGS